MLQTHSKNQHRGRCLLPSQEYTLVTQNLSDAGYRTSKAEKYFQPRAQKPVDGLEVLTGFSCPLLREDGTPCPRSFLGKSTFERHLSDHRGLPKPKTPSCASTVQTLFGQGGLQHYFSVDTSLSDLDPLASSAYTHAVRMLPTLPKAHIPISNHDKDRASIHWFTRWPELLQRYVTNDTSSEFFRSLVSFPDPHSDPGWLAKLLDHGSRWWNNAEAAHIKCSYRASVMLRSHQKWVTSLSS